jgi:hypothetical protein
MPHIPGRVPNPQYRVGLAGAASLAERYEVARAKAMREIPENDPERGVINSMISEASIDLMMDAIGRAIARKAPPEPSPMMTAAQSQWWNLVTVHNQLSHSIRTSQRWLEIRKDDWKFRLMGNLITANCFSDFPPMSASAGDTPEWKSIEEAHAALEKLNRTITHMRGIEAQINSARGFEALDKGDRALELLRVFATRHYQEFDERLERLEAAVSALAAIHNQSPRKKSKSKRSKPTAGEANDSKITRQAGLQHRRSRTNAELGQ